MSEKCPTCGQLVTPPKSLAELIKWHRSKKGMTQQELADLIGIARSQIANIEAGTSENPSIKTLSRFIKVLGIKKSDFMNLLFDEES